MRKWLFLCLVLLLVPAHAETLAPGRAEYEAGAVLFKNGQQVEAREKFREGLLLAPDDPDLVYAVAVITTNLKEYEEARKLWTHYKKIEPTDWIGPASLIRVNQLIGDKAARDAERELLYSLYRAGDKKDFPVSYWRDEFKAGEPARVVQVFEAFEFEGPFQSKYTFAVFEKRDDDKPIGRVQLESMDSDTQIARELGTIGPDQRVYTLDWNGAGGHRTYNYFQAEPQYDELKKMVIEILDGKVSPASGTYRAE